MFGFSRLFLLGIFFAGIITGIVAKPFWKEAIMAWNQESYSELVARCDGSMKSHLMAKHRVAVEPTENNVRLLEAAEIGLIDCQEYDLKRKRLIRWGLDDNDLANMGLLAIEANATELQKVIKIHEFRY